MEDRESIEIPLTVDPANSGQRLDRFLVRRFGRLSRSRVHRMIARGGVRRADSGEVLSKGALRVHEGLELIITRPAPDEPDVVMDYEVLHEDPDLLVLDKPAGLPVHPSARYHRHTLTALMRERMGPEHGWEMAHRLDRETSGVMIFGRRGSTGPELKKAFLRREVHKTYLAIVYGACEAQVIDRPIGPAVNSKVLIKVGPRPLDEGGLAARTDVEPMKGGTFEGAPITLVRCTPHTGRTHQIRVHLDLVGHPLVGDKLYGVDEERFLDVVERGRPVAEYEAELGLGRHALHARSLDFRHPGTGEPVSFRAPWPEELASIVEA